jgi:hypothetical protein
LKTTFATNYTFTPLTIFIVLSIATAMEKTESTETVEETGGYLHISTTTTAAAAQQQASRGRFLRA